MDLQQRIHRNNTDYNANDTFTCAPSLIEDHSMHIVRCKQNYLTKLKCIKRTQSLSKLKIKLVRQWIHSF